MGEWSGVKRGGIRVYFAHCSSVPTLLTEIAALLVLSSFANIRSSVEKV